MTRLERLEGRARRASDELDTVEYPPSDGPYFRLAAWSHEVGLAERTDLATTIYRTGNAALRGSRCFDNCFEMGDGRAVCRELTRRADTDPVLHAAIAQDFGRTFPAHWTHEARSAELAL